MLSKLYSAVNSGLKGELVEVEIDLASGFPSFSIVGLADKAVQESKERVHSAIINSGLKFPSQNKIIVNLAPADVKKEGPLYDLPIALGILVASSQLPEELILEKEKSIFLGELALNGDLRHTKGILPIALFAREKKFKNIFLPQANKKEASLAQGLKIFPLKSLKDLIGHFTGKTLIKPCLGKKIKIKPKEDYEIDFAYIKGQEQIKRALEVSAAGGHNLIMMGPPGAGKTLLARALSSILPPLEQEEILEVTKIYSVSGLLKEGEPFITERPFRNPHHSISDVAMVGGGQFPRPGEISLAHRGVLFLDEIAEFSRHVLENLRQPLEDGKITVSRAKATISLPAKFILIAALNPCPCGFFNDPTRNCTCSPSQIIKYRKKISGPLLDRIDLHLEVPKIEVNKLTSEKVAESSDSIKNRVIKARQIQKRRYQSLNILTNSELRFNLIKKFCQIDKSSSELLEQATIKYNLSARSYHKILKVSRTIADLSQRENIILEDIAEAVQYRVKSEESIF